MVENSVKLLDVRNTFLDTNVGKVSTALIDVEVPDATGQPTPNHETTLVGFDGTSNVSGRGDADTSDVLVCVDSPVGDGSAQGSRETVFNPEVVCEISSDCGTSLGNIV